MRYRWIDAVDAGLRIRPTVNFAEIKAISLTGFRLA